MSIYLYIRCIWKSVKEFGISSHPIPCVSFFKSNFSRNNCILSLVYLCKGKLGRNFYTSRYTCLEITLLDFSLKKIFRGIRSTCHESPFSFSALSFISYFNKCPLGTFHQCCCQVRQCSFHEEEVETHLSQCREREGKLLLRWGHNETPAATFTCWPIGQSGRPHPPSEWKRKILSTSSYKSSTRTSRLAALNVPELLLLLLLSPKW